VRGGSEELHSKARSRPEKLEPDGKRNTEGGMNDRTVTHVYLERKKALRGGETKRRKKP